MKIPLTIAIGKSLDDLVKDHLSKIPLGTRMREMNVRSNYVDGHARDKNIRRGYTLLPIVAEWKKTGERKKPSYSNYSSIEEKIVEVLSYDDIFPNTSVIGRKGEKKDQTQIIISEDGLVLRRPNVNYHKDEWEVKYALSHITNVDRRLFEVMIREFVREILSNTKEYYVSQDYHELHNVDKDDISVYNFKLLLPENEIDKKSLQEDERIGRSKPATSKPIYECVIKPTLQELGYTICE